LSSERAVSAELRDELIRERQLSSTKKVVSFSPLLQVTPAGSGRQYALEATSESRRSPKDYVLSILETENTNLDKLQKELRKHLELGSSSMCVFIAIIMIVINDFLFRILRLVGTLTATSMLGDYNWKKN
jgi:hypothetical protein